MAATASAMSSLLAKLSALLVEEVKLSRRAKHDIKFLEQELVDIRGFILAHTEEPVPDQLQALFARDVRELSYDIEDILDTFMQLETGMKLRRYEGMIDKCKDLFKKAKMRRKLAVSIQEIKSRVAELSNRRVKYGGVVTKPSNTVVDPRLAAMFTNPSALVGVEDPLDELSRLLLMKDKAPDSAAQLKVISIVGSGGLGKTTLANLIYRKTRACFDFGAWVSVSPKPNLKKILIDILTQFEGPRIVSGQEGELEEMDVVEKITRFLQNKRYLFVMDDVWSSDVCDSIRCALPMNNLGSRIIVTTCIYSVAESCCSHWNDHIYNIKPLSMKDSRFLFHSRIFGSGNEFPPEFAEVSDKILNKCSGVPLAIITMSALLASRPLKRRTWEEVCDSIGATSNSIEGMKSIFFLSYYNLPQHLKVCFLYLSIFPEDYPINRGHVVRSWMAEGFILTKQGETAEQVGENYFNELINRQMIHPVHGNYDGKPETYLIHGMMLDLIKSKSIEENFVTILDNRKHVSVLHGKIRRLSLINIDQNHYPELKNNSHVRTLYIFGSVGQNFSFKYFKFLRVLDLEGCKDLMNHNVKEIPGLIHLRYLSFRDTHITELPEQIERLQSLRTLDLRGTKVLELPTSIVRLTMLAHLLCDKMRFPEGIEKMTALSCLSQFDILQSNINAVKELGNLSELRELVLWWSPDMESSDTERYQHYLATSLYRLDKLQSLYIHGSNSSVDFLDHFHHRLWQLHSIRLNSSCYLTRIPQWFVSLPGLTYVSIDIKEVKSEDLQLLSELNCLLHLSVSSKVVPTEKVVISSNGFRALKEFHLHYVRAITFEPRAMPTLEFLLLSLCVLPEETCVCCSISIGQFMRLKKIDIRIHGEGAAVAQLLEATDAAIRKVANELPNRPVVNIIALGNSNDYAMKEAKEKEQGKEIIKVV